MNIGIINALKTRAATLPGGRDKEKNLLFLVSVPAELQPKSKENLELCVNFIIDALNHETLLNGLVVVIDAQKSSWRLTKSWISHVQSLIDVDYTKNILVIRHDAFWDKQRVESCTKSHKPGDPIVIPRSRLTKYFEASELPEELGGAFMYNHEQWIQNQVRIQDFKATYVKVIADLDNLHKLLVDNQLMLVRASEIDQIMKTCTICGNDVERRVKFAMDMGNKLISQINELQNSGAFTSQDLLDAKEAIKDMLNNIESKQVTNRVAWEELEKFSVNMRELAKLEKGLSSVINWILNVGEDLMNQQLKVGYDVASSEKLRQDHEIIEMKCWITYGQYAELLYKINCLKQPDSSALRDLKAQRDFMNFICRSFATRLERRRNILITSVRFFKLVARYFRQTSEVFEALIMGDKVDDHEEAKTKLAQLKDHQKVLDCIEVQLIRQGEKLSDMLAMPVKNALGRDIEVDYSVDIAHVRDTLDATKARRNIFIDSVDLQKLTLEQITFIHMYETDAQVASKWMNDLYNVLLKSHTHVGCTVSEIQKQKDEHQSFQDTARATFNYGVQLLNASQALRQSCKLPLDKTIAMVDHLQVTWNHLLTISQEQMTRLRVCAVFHRSVEDQCLKLNSISDEVKNLYTIVEETKRQREIRRLLNAREKLMVEVGRMVRLGRLLKNRLKEPFILEDKQESAMSREVTDEKLIKTPDNSIACEAIADRLNDVTRFAEALDAALKVAQRELDLSFDSTDSEAEKKPIYANLSEDWNFSIKSSTEDEYVTASENTPHSRSSSYHTASECAHSPWWEQSHERNSLDADSLDQEAPSMALLSGVVVSSTNVSFDDSAHTFQSPDNSESEDTIPSLVHLPPPPPELRSQLATPPGHLRSQFSSQFRSQLPPIYVRKSSTTPPTEKHRSPSRLKHSHDSQEDSQFESPEEDVKSASSLELLDTRSDSACSMEKVSPHTITSEDGDEVRNNNNDSNNNGFAVNFSKLKESGLSYYYQNIITKQVMLVSNN